MAEATATRDETSFRTELEAIGHILRDRKLAVPAFQRPYSWETDEVESFWSDLRAAQTQSNPEYFMGTIVLTPGQADRMTIIDGQQRLATASLLLAAIRDAFHSRGDPDRAAVIEKDYLAARSLRSAEMEPRLTLSTEDDAFFRALVLQHPPRRIDPERSSHGRLVRAFDYLTRELALDIDTAGPHWAERLINWADFLEHAVRIIVVYVPTEADAFLTFETLNDRGLELTIADLLRNYLFGLAKDDPSAVQIPWEAAVSTLDTGDARTFTTFLRQYWSSIHGATREKELYGELRRYVRSRRDAIAFTNELRDAASDYAALLDPDNTKWTEYDDTVRAAAQTLDTLGLVQSRPLLLAALDSFDASELARLMTAAVSWSVRGLIVGGIGGGTTERYYANAAAQIRRGKAVNTDAVFGALAGIVPTDDQFISAMTTAGISRISFARYLLIAFEKAQRNGENSNLTTRAELAEYSVDGVLPRSTAARDWQSFDASETGTWARRLGNLVILRGGAKLRSPSWPERRLELAHSDVVLTRATADPPDWTPDTIMRRQELLASFAAEIWPREARRS